MSKIVKILLSIFIGLDVFVAGFYLLAQLRVTMFGTGAIPGGGSAIDMAFFLLPLFVAWVAGDRFYFFLTYKERRARRLQNLAESSEAQAHNLEDVVKHDPSPDKKPNTVVSMPAGSIWDERNWDEHS